MCQLYARSDTRLKYDDFLAFNGMTVGYEKGSTIISQFGKNYGREMGFSVKTRAYASGTEMFAALDREKWDSRADEFPDTWRDTCFWQNAVPAPYILPPLKPTAP